MARRRTSTSRHSGTTRGTVGRTRSRKGGWNLFSLFRLGRPKKRRQVVVVQRNNAAFATPRLRRSRARTKRGYAARFLSWAVGKVVNRRWRHPSLSEALIWLAVGAVSLAFLILLAKSALLIAAAVFLLLVAFAWRELGER